MRKWKSIVSAGVLMFAMVAVAALPVMAKTEDSVEHTIPKNVFFATVDGEEIDAEGMTPEEVQETIEDYVEELKNTSILLMAEDKTLETTIGALGLKWINEDIIEEASGIKITGNMIQQYKAMKDLEVEPKIYDVELELDTALIQSIVEAGVETLETKAVDGRIEKTPTTGFNIIPGVTGVAIKVEESVTAVADAVMDIVAGTYVAPEVTLEDTVEAVPVKLVTELTTPKGTQEELSKITTEIGMYVTYFDNTVEGRTQNLINGTKKINGSIVYPGETFSVIDAVSPFTFENGYGVATAYQDGKHVDSIGGGICQVSTTLYNALILAELNVTERYPHSMTVGYVPYSHDAAIATPYKDLKFVNNTNAPIYIEGYVIKEHGTICFKVYGQAKEAGRVVSYVSETISETEAGFKFTASAEREVGDVTMILNQHLGVKAKLWKVVTVNGVEVSRTQINSSSYRSAIGEYEVGIKSDDPEAVAAMQAAIATQNLDVIMAEAEKWAQKEVEIVEPEVQPDEPVGGEVTDTETDDSQQEQQSEVSEN